MHKVFSTMFRREFLFLRNSHKVQGKEKRVKNISREIYDTFASQLPNVQEDSSHLTRWPLSRPRPGEKLLVSVAGIFFFFFFTRQSENSLWQSRSSWYILPRDDQSFFTGFLLYWKTNYLSWKQCFYSNWYIFSRIEQYSRPSGFEWNLQSIDVLLNSFML